MGLGAGKVLHEAKKPMLISSSSSPAYTTPQCPPYNSHWVYDVVALANGTVKPLVAAGKKKWFFIGIASEVRIAINDDALLKFTKTAKLARASLGL